jgi:hypothetical protein
MPDHCFSLNGKEIIDLGLELMRELKICIVAIVSASAGASLMSY